MKLDLNIDIWKEFRVGDLFLYIISGKCDNASSLLLEMKLIISEQNIIIMG